LKKEFPEYGEISTKKNGMTEFRLKKILARTGGEEEVVSKKSKTNKKQSKSDKNRTVKKL
jgi:arsenate reductase-like glutaredoxin family protein